MLPAISPAGPIVAAASIFRDVENLQAEVAMERAVESLR